MKFFVFACLLISGCAVSTTAQENAVSEVVLTQLDNEKPVSINTNDVITIKLEENPSTGYSWAIAKNNDEILSLLSSDYFQPQAQAPVLGAPGERTFTFKAKRAGNVNLALKYWRAWAGDSSIASQFKTAIHIK